MKFRQLILNPENNIPKGFVPIIAYAKGDCVVVPLDDIQGDDVHDCDAEGCSMDHVASFNIKAKYQSEPQTRRDDRKGKSKH